jgi:hypothetical protein
MNHNPPAPVGPSYLESPSGLTVQVNANGSIRRMDHGDMMLNLFLGNETEGGPSNLYLRRHGKVIEVMPLLGPRSPAAARCDERSLTFSGEWRGIRFVTSMMLAESASAWFWHVELENAGSGPGLRSGPGLGLLRGRARAFGSRVQDPEPMGRMGLEPGWGVSR